MKKGILDLTEKEFKLAVLNELIHEWEGKRQEYWPMSVAAINGLQKWRLEIEGIEATVQSDSTGFVRRYGLDRIVIKGSDLVSNPNSAEVTIYYTGGMSQRVLVGPIEEITIE